MKVALMLPGYLDSPDYLHMKTFNKRLKELGYITEILDPCNLWKTGNIKNYSISNYLKQITKKVESYKNQKTEEIVLVGHSLGAFMAIIAGNRIKEVTKIISLCPPSDRKYLRKEWKPNKFRHSIRELPNDPQKTRTFNVPYLFVEDGNQYSAREEVKNIDKPLMIFISIEDKVVLPQETEKIVANAKNPYVVKQPNMGHDFKNSQKECNIVMNHIENFLNLTNL